MKEEWVGLDLISLSGSQWHGRFQLRAGLLEKSLWEDEGGAKDLQGEL